MIAGDVKTEDRLLLKVKALQKQVVELEVQRFSEKHPERRAVLNRQYALLGYTKLIDSCK
jgi:hypothetical protein